MRSTTRRSSSFARSAAPTSRSKANEEAFNKAVEEVAATTRTLLDSLVTKAPPKDREVETEKRKARSAERFATA